MAVASRFEVKQRIDFVFSLILSGVRYSDLITQFIENYPVKRQMAKLYIQKAQAQIERETAGNNKQIISWHVAARLKQLREAEKLNDLSERLYHQREILKDLGKVHGIYREIIEIRTPEQEAVELAAAKKLFLGEKNKQVQWENGKSEWGS